MTDQTPHQEIQPIIIVRKKRHDAQHAHSSAWKIALADFMTTMMIVFFVMWIVNLMPPQKKLQLVSFFQGKKIDEVMDSNGVLPQKAPDTGKLSENMQIYYALEPALKKIDSSLKIYLSRGRLEINLNSNVLFQSGKSDISPTFKKIIDEIYTVVANKDVYVDVYGYADNQPIAGGTNLILSSTRAQNAAKAFIQLGLPDTRMGVHGEGDRFPVAENSTEQGRSLNRRIVIYISPIKPQEKDKQELESKNEVQSVPVENKPSI